MSPAAHGWSDEEIEQWVGSLLRIGVVLATAVVAFGGVLYLFKHGLTPAAHRTFDGEPENLRDPVAVAGGALSLRSRSVIQLGLLLLIATPVVRVLFSVVAFARQRDFVYVVITLVVLAVLLFSLFSGQDSSP